MEILKNLYQVKLVHHKNVVLFYYHFHHEEHLLMIYQEYRKTFHNSLKLYPIVCFDKFSRSVSLLIHM